MIMMSVICDDKQLRKIKDVGYGFVCERPKALMMAAVITSKVTFCC